MIGFNKDEKEVIVYSIKENINCGKLQGGDIPYSLELATRLDNTLTNEDLNLIDYCTSESYNKTSKQQFSNEYSDTLDGIRYKFFIRNNK